MDQTIGIEYTVSGIEKIMQDHNKLAESFESTLNRIKSSVTAASNLTSTAFTQFSPQNAKTNLTGLAEMQSRAVDTNKSLNAVLDEQRNQKTDQLLVRLHGTAGLAHKAANEMERLTAAVLNYNSAVGSSKGMRFNFKVDDKGNVTPESQKDKTPKQEKGIADQFLDKSAFFMFRYRLYNELFNAASYSMLDIGLGRSRQNLAKGLGELSAVAFTPGQKKQTEVAAMQFGMKFWTSTAEEYINAMSMTASAFDIDKIGFKNLQRMNEAALKFGRLSKLTGEQASELMTGIVLQVMSRLPEDVRAELNKGNAAQVKGYGYTDIGGIAEKTAAQAAKAIQISTVWGPGIAGAFKYMLPELMGKGWDVSAALSLLGAVKNQGFPAPQIGRAIKEVMLSAPEDYAKAVLLSTGMWEESNKLGTGVLPSGDAKAINEERAKKLGDWITKNLFSTPEMFEKALPVLNKYVEDAEKKGENVIKDMGFSKYFISIIRQLGQTGTMETMKLFREQIGKAEFDAITSMVNEQLDDAGTAYMRISNSFTRFYQAVADSPMAHGIAGPVSNLMDYMTMYVQMPKLAKKMGLNNEMAVEMFDREFKAGITQTFGQDRAEMLRGRLQFGDHWRRDWMVLETTIVGAIAGTLAGGPILGTLIGAAMGMLLGDTSYTKDRMFLDSLDKQRKAEEAFAWDFNAELGAILPSDSNGSLVTQAITLFSDWAQSTAASLFEVALYINTLPGDAAQAVAKAIKSVIDFFKNKIPSMFWAESGDIPDNDSKPTQFFGEWYGQIKKAFSSAGVDVESKAKYQPLQTPESKPFFSEEWSKPKLSQEFLSQKYQEAVDLVFGRGEDQFPDPGRRVINSTIDSIRKELNFWEKIGTWWNEQLQVNDNWELPFPGGVRYGNRVIDMNADTSFGEKLLSGTEQLPPFVPQTMRYVPFPSVPAEPASYDNTPIQIENKLLLDGRELAFVIAEIIQRNRAVNGQGFGGDPFGFNTGLA